MGCNATGLDENSPSKAPATTTESLIYSGSYVSSFFRDVPLVTNSKSLLTYTPGVTPSRSLKGAQAKATTTANPIYIDTGTPKPATAESTAASPTKSSAASPCVDGKRRLYAAFGLTAAVAAGVF